jgi:exonuclease III
MDNNNENNNVHLNYKIATINLNTISNNNKINSLKTFVRLLDLDIILFQEVDNGDLELNDFNIFFNIDETKRGTAIALRSHIEATHIEKSLDSRLIALRINNNITICNIYGPSGSQHRAYREAFYNTTLAYHLRNATDFLIVGGDFNAVVNSKDSLGNSNHSHTLKSALTNLQLVDTWEILNGNRVEYTYVQAGVGARLDRIYVTKNLKDQVRDNQVVNNAFSDHKTYTSVINLPHLGPRYGYGTWKMNINILNDEAVINEFYIKWQYWTRQRQNYRGWYRWWSDYVKPRIKSFFRWKTSEKFKIFHDTMEFYYTNLKKLYHEFISDPSKRTAIQKLKGKMLHLQFDFSRTYANTNKQKIQGERLSIFQIGEQRKKRGKTRIKKIQSE